MEYLNALLAIVQKVGVVVFVLGSLIFVHELGHFLLAKFNGVGVLEFAIGFGRKVFSKKWKGTRYSLRLIPLGGFVRMVGDDPKVVRGGELPGGHPEDALGFEIEPEDQAMIDNEDLWFLKKGFLAKSSIVIAGPAFNFIFAILLAIGTAYYYGVQTPVEQPRIGSLMPDYPAEKAGLKEHDFISSINGVPLVSWEELSKTVSQSEGKELALAVTRPSAIEGGKSESLVIKVTGEPMNSEMALLEGKEGTVSYKIGIGPDFTRTPVSFVDASITGVHYVWRLSSLTVMGLVRMVQGVISPKHIGGPIQIFKEAADSAKGGAERVLNFMIFLSVSLGVLNLLPIPILDGGHLVFYTIESIIRSPINLRVYEIATQVGMFILFALMVFALGNDLTRLFGFQ